MNQTYKELMACCEISMQYVNNNNHRIILIDLQKNIINHKKVFNKCNIHYFNNIINRISEIVNIRHILKELEKQNNEKRKNKESRQEECKRLGLGNYNKAREKALKRANGKSELSGKSLKNGHAVHHINGYDKHLSGRCDINNLIVLTTEEHKAFHKKYGKGNNTMAQWEEFVSNTSFEKSNKSNTLQKYSTKKSKHKAYEVGEKRRNKNNSKDRITKIKEMRNKCKRNKKNKNNNNKNNNNKNKKNKNNNNKNKKNKRNIRNGMKYMAQCTINANDSFERWKANK